MPVFDKFKTGEKNPESGLYYCTGCGEIIPLSKDEKFPPCTDCGSATWMMVAVAGEAGQTATWMMVAVAGEAGQTYGIGKECEQSGLYLCKGCMNQIIPLSKGEKFPPCRSCGTNTKWQLIVHA